MVWWPINYINLNNTKYIIKIEYLVEGNINHLTFQCYYFVVGTNLKLVREQIHGSAGNRTLNLLFIIQTSKLVKKNPRIGWESNPQPSDYQTNIKLWRKNPRVGWKSNPQPGAYHTKLKLVKKKPTGRLGIEPATYSLSMERLEHSPTRVDALLKTTPPQKFV